MPNRLFLILAALFISLATARAQQFQVAPEYAITSGGNPTSIAAGDFKGDGAGDDMAVVDTTGTVSIFLNNRDGSATFSTPATVPIPGGTAPYYIATGAFTQNGQRWKDLVVADSVGHVTVLASNSGVFTIADQKQVTGIAVTSMIAADVNGDGLSDVEIGDANTANVWAVGGAGGGKLQTPTGPFTSSLAGSQPVFLAAGSFTAMGQPLPDVAAVTQDGNAAVLQNISSGSINFNPGVLVTPGGGCFQNPQPPVTAAVAGYFEQPSGSDAGVADLAIASVPPTSANCPPAINILLDLPPSIPYFFSFYFQAEPAPVGLTPMALTVADVNGDQAPDVVMANQGDNSISVLFNDTSGGASFCTTGCPFAPVPMEFGTGFAPIGVAAGNFHLGAHQPFPDVAVAHQADQAGNGITVLSNLGNGTDASGVAIWLGYGASCVYDSQGQNCNASAKPARADYIGLQTQAPTALATANFFLQAPSSLPDLAMTGQQIPSLGDFSSVTLWENDCDLGSPCLKGDFTNIIALNFFGSSNLYISMAAADFNGDGYSDMAVMDNTGTANLFLSMGGGFGPGSQYPVTTATTSYIASGIFISGHVTNQQDLVVADSQGAVTVLSNNNDGSGSFAVLPPNQVSANFSSIVAADLNGDGITDVVAADANTGTVWVFQGPVNPTTGAFAASFQVTANLPAQQQPVSIALGFNQNQLPVYLVAVSQDGTLSLLPNASSGSTISFGTPIVYSPGTTGIPGGVTAVTTGDFNIDGFADVAVASAPQGKVPTVWFLPNTSNGGTLSLGTAQPFVTGGMPIALTTADINQDGIPDLIAANEGSNTASIFISKGNSKQTVNITLTSSLNPSGLGQSVTFTATVSSSSGSGTPTGTVQFLDGSTPLGSSPLTGGSASFTTSSLTMGTHTITAAYSGDFYFNPRVSAPIMQVVGPPPDFAMTISPTGTTITPGSSANFTIKVAPQNSFTGTVTLSCSWTGMPAGTSCQLSPATVTLSSDGRAAASTLTVSTAPGALSSRRPAGGRPFRVIYAFGFWLGPVAFSWVMVVPRKGRKLLTFVLMVLLAAGLLFSSACGGGGSSHSNSGTGTPVGTYNIVVAAFSSGSSKPVQHSGTVTVNVQ